MIVTFKIKEDFQFDASKEDIIKAANNLPIKKERLNGYFVEIEDKEYRMMDLMRQLILDKGFKIDRINRVPSDFISNFNKLGFKVWKKNWLSTTPKVLFSQDVRNMFVNDLMLDSEKKINSDLLVVNGRDFLSFRKIVFGLNGLQEIKTFDQIESQPGLLLISNGSEESQIILFVDYVENLTKFMNDLSLIVHQIKDNLRSSLWDKEEQEEYDRDLEKELKKWKKYDIDPRVLMIIREMYNLLDEEVVSFFKSYSYTFYFSKGKADEKEVKNIVGQVKPLWNYIADSKPKTPEMNNKVFLLKISVQDTKVWRKVLVKSNTKLAKLHHIIQILMDWSDDHLHVFRFGTLEIKSEKIEIGNFLKNPGDEISYEYDFGDSWQISIKLEEIKEYDPQKQYPLCTDGKKAGPLEDSGGYFGYNQLIDSYLDPSAEDHEEIVKWAGKNFDPDKFDIKKINSRLKNL